MVMDRIQIIKMEMIDRPLRISREIIDQDQIRELAESIREKGLLEPILLRPLNGRYEIVAGDRRFLAHKFLDLKKINAIVKELDDHDTVIVRAIENLQRVDLTPVEEGRVYLVLKEEGGFSEVEIAKKTGKNRNTIRRYLNLLRYPDYVQNAVNRKTVILDVADTLMEVEDEGDRKNFFDMAIGNGITARVARLWVDDYFKSKAGKYYEEGGVIPPPEFIQEVKPTFMTCESCQGPVEIKLARNVILCPECRKKVRHT